MYLSVRKTSAKCIENLALIIGGGNIYIITVLLVLNIVNGSNLHQPYMMCLVRDLKLTF